MTCCILKLETVFIFYRISYFEHLHSLSSLRSLYARKLIHTGNEHDALVKYSVIIDSHHYEKTWCMYNAQKHN